MKKLSKALAVVLSLCIMLGMIAIVASAADTNQLDASQYGEGITLGTYADFDTSNGSCSNGGGKYKNGTTINLTTFIAATSTKTLTVGDATTKYYHFKTKDTAPTDVLSDVSSYPFAYCFTNTSGEKVLSAYDFVTVDFDFAAIGADTYSDGMNFGIYTVKPDSYPCNLYVVTDGTDWYLSNSKTFDISKVNVKISDEINVWNHVTYLFDFKSISEGKIPVYVYANGEYFHTFSISATSATEIQRIRFSFSDYIGADKCDFGVDNVTCNKYAKGYTSSGFGLDDFVADDPTQSISTLSDVVYKSGYTYTVCAEGQYTVVDGTSYAIDALASKAIVKGSVIEIADDFVYTGNAYSFTVIAKNGAKFDAKGSEYTASLVSDADGVKTYKYTSILAPDLPGSSTDYFYSYNTGIGGTYDTYMQWSGNFKVEDADIGGNRYALLSDISTNTLTKNGIFRIPVGTSASLTNNYDYKVIDFDFMTTTNFYDGMTFYLFDGVQGYAPASYIYSDGNGGYILSENGQKKNTVSIGAPNTWTHMTFIVKSNGSFDVYVNDEYFCSKTGDAIKTGYIKSLCVFFLSGTTVHNFTLGIDNVSVRNFNKGYNSGSAFGIDDYAALGDNTLPIYSLEDNIYGPNYAYTGTCANTPAASNNGGSYIVPSGAFVNAANNDTVTLNGDYVLYTELDKSIESLNIVGGNIILKDRAASVYSFKDGKLFRTATYLVEVLDYTDEVIDQYEIAIDQIFSLDLLQYNGSLNGNFKQALAWDFSIDGGAFAPFSEFAGAAAGQVVTLSPNSAAVYWYTEEGELVADDEWFIGSIPTRGAGGLPELEVLNNGYYELAYEWYLIDEEASEVLLEDAYYCVRVVPVEAFTGLKFNYTLSSSYRPNFYVPVPTDSSITVTYAKSGAGLNLNAPGSEDGYFDDMEEAGNSGNIIRRDITSTVKIGGTDYYRFECGTISAYTWYAAYGFEVCFEVEYNDEIYELSSKVACTRIGSKSENAKAVSYVNTVLANGECGESEEKMLVLNWVRYINEAYRIQSKNNVAIEGITSILNKHQTCGCLDDITTSLPTEEQVVNTSEIKALGEGFGATFRIAAENGRFALYVPVAYADAAENLKIWAEIDGINNATATIGKMNVDFVRYEVLNIEKSEEAGVDVYEPVIYQSGGVNCYLFLSDVNTGIYNINALYNLKIEVDGEIVATGTYSLAAYLYNINAKYGYYKLDAETGKYVRDESVAANTDYYSFTATLALAEFGKAAFNYKVN